MELAIYFSNVDLLLDLDEALRPLDGDAIPSFLKTLIFDNDTSSREYYGNLVGTRWYEQFTEHWGIAPSRLYFGQEFCEYLIPSTDVLTQAYYYCRQLGWDFTYVTGCCTDAGVARQRANFAFLAEQDEPVEVVVNDWGILRVLRREFPDLEPVLGRLLTKQKRLALHAGPKNPLAVNTDGMELSVEEIREHQVKALRNTDLANEDYRQDLRDLGFGRVDVDIVPQGIDLPGLGSGLDFGCYYPWGYVAGGRNCLTAGVIDPEREFVVLDKPCPRPCQRFNKSTARLHGDEIVIQRGNSVFAFHSEYAAPYVNGKLPFSRIVFEPYIPI
jgi:hypothetical protein